MSLVGHASQTNSGPLFTVTWADAGILDRQWVDSQEPVCRSFWKAFQRQPERGGATVLWLGWGLRMD